MLFKSVKTQFKLKRNTKWCKIYTIVGRFNALKFLDWLNNVIMVQTEYFFSGEHNQKCSMRFSDNLFKYEKVKSIIKCFTIIRNKSLEEYNKFNFIHSWVRQGVSPVRCLILKINLQNFWCVPIYVAKLLLIYGTHCCKVIHLWLHLETIMGLHKFNDLVAKWQTVEIILWDFSTSGCCSGSNTANPEKLKSFY